MSSSPELSREVEPKTDPLVNEFDASALRASIGGEALDNFDMLVGDVGLTALDGAEVSIDNTPKVVDLPSVRSESTAGERLADSVDENEPSQAGIDAVNNLVSSSRFMQRSRARSQAKAERAWRANVRVANKDAVKQEVRDAKQSLKITEQTYNRSGRRILRRIEQNKLIDDRNKVINGLFDSGELTKRQARRLRSASRRDARSSARESVERTATQSIIKAEARLDDAVKNRNDFFDKYGRRSNSSRQNKHRVRERRASGTSYSYYDTPSHLRVSLAEQWQKRQEEIQAQRDREAAERRSAAARKAAATRSRKRSEAAKPPLKVAA